MQYTVRNIPEYLDAALRTLAREQGKSLNEVATAALVRGAGLNEQPRKKRDLEDVAGSWREDAEFEQALAEQDKIDESMWPKQRKQRRKLAKRPAA
jgi:plasmid stability protein